MGAYHTAYGFYGVEANLPPGGVDPEGYELDWMDVQLPKGLQHLTTGDMRGGGMADFIVLSSSVRRWSINEEGAGEQKLPVRRDAEDSDELYALLKQGDLLSKTDANTEGWYLGGYSG